MFSALTEILSLGLGWEGRGEMGGQNRNNAHRDPLLALPTFLRDQHTLQSHSIPCPMRSLWLGLEGWRSLSPTCSCR